MAMVVSGSVAWPASSMKTCVKCEGGKTALASLPAVTSVETTGPDGQPMHDETSQQSTLSQSSDNSGGRQTPKGGYPQVIISAVTARLH